MDKKTVGFLRNLGLSLPHSFRKRLIRTEKRDDTERQGYEQLLKSKRTSEKGKGILRKLLSQERFQQEELVVDDKVDKEVGAWYDAKIKGAIERGEIKKWDPNKDPQGRHLYEKATKNSGHDGGRTGGSRPMARPSIPPAQRIDGRHGSMPERRGPSDWKRKTFV